MYKLKQKTILFEPLGQTSEAVSVIEYPLDIEMSSLTLLRATVYAVGSRFFPYGEKQHACFQGVCAALVDTPTLDAVKGDVVKTNTLLHEVAFFHIIEMVRPLDLHPEIATLAFDRLDGESHTDTFKRVLADVKSRKSRGGGSCALLDVYEALLAGMSARETATLLDVSVNCVNFRRGVIQRKAAAYIAGQAKAAVVV